MCDNNYTPPSSSETPSNPAKSVADEPFSPTTPNEPSHTSPSSTTDQPNPYNALHVPTDQPDSPSNSCSLEEEVRILKYVVNEQRNQLDNLERLVMLMGGAIKEIIVKLKMNK